MHHPKPTTPATSPPRATLGLALVLGLALLTTSTRAQDLVVTPGGSNGVYATGQPVRWDLRGPDNLKVPYVIKQGGQAVVSSGTIELHDGNAQLETAAGKPGWILAKFTPASTNAKPTHSLGGALVAPEQIQPSAPRPDDFDAFWQAKLKELDSVPANPQLTAGESGKPGVDYFKITLNNIRGSHIRGQLARPNQGQRFPAMLVVQWAGVYGLQKNWVTDHAAEGWLVLNLNAHDLPIDEPEAFYKQQSDGPLKDYPSIGNDDRETSYFLRMYLSCFRGAQYLAERPDWNGQTLVVTGGSQGGLQSFVTAALHPKVTALMANVPAGCDLNGPEAARLPGWPMWHWSTKDKDAAKVRQAARYFDVVNFAPSIRCAALVGIGLIDTTCPAPGIFAACNQLRGPKELVVLPTAEHGDRNNSHAPYYGRFNAWKAALLRGAPAPVK